MNTDSILEAFRPVKPFRVIGIIDAYGAVHGVPIFPESAQSVCLIHSDVFTTAFKRWRYVPKDGFQTMPDTERLAEYELTEEEADSVLSFLRRRGWE